jgi:hypothetical protein
MRKRRVIIFNDDPRTRSALNNFFDTRGYETMTLLDPRLCPVYENEEGCQGPNSCGDIVILSHHTPTMNNIDLFVRQQKLGCKLSANNKAIIAGSLPDGGRAALSALGSEFFQTPLDLRKLEKWVTECETRIDLDRPVAIRRKEERQEPPNKMLSVFLAGNSIERVTVVNKSICGACLRTSHRLMPNKLILLREDSPGASEDALVRWVKTAGDGTFLVGLSFCV